MRETLRKIPLLGASTVGLNAGMTVVASAENTMKHSNELRSLTPHVWTFDSRPKGDIASAKGSDESNLARGSKVLAFQIPLCPVPPFPTGILDPAKGRTISIGKWHSLFVCFV